MKTLSESRLSRMRRSLTVFAGLLLLWALATLGDIPAFLLPSPRRWHRRCGTTGRTSLITR